MRIRYVITVLLLSACCAGGWFFVHQQGEDKPRFDRPHNVAENERMTEPQPSTDSIDTDVHLPAKLTLQTSCFDKKLPVLLSALFSERSSLAAIKHSTDCLVQRLREMPSHEATEQLVTTDTFFQWLSFVFINQEKLLAALHVTPLLTEQNLFSFLSIVQTLELQPEVIRYLAFNESSLRELNTAVLGYLLANAPYELLDILNAGLSDEINIPIVGLLLSATHPFSLAELWPVLIKVELDEERDVLLQGLVQQYLAKDEEATMYYLSDFYQLSTSDSYGRKYHFPKAINTLMAWHLNHLNALNPEEYDKDSLMVIKKVGELLTEDPQQLFEQMKQVKSSELQHKVFASVIQSKAFFGLNKPELLRTLTQQPPELAHLLARAYVLQFAYLEGEEYQAKIEGLGEYLRPVTTEKDAVE